MTVKGIDPPEYRYEYYSEAIQNLPEYFAKSSSGLVVIDETLHLQEYRQFWQDTANELNIKIFWINVNCDDELLKQRLLKGKNRENHILGDKAYSINLLFEDSYDPMDGPHESIDTDQDIVPQVQRIIKKLKL